jgi:prevent-host-death family protein
MSMTVGIRELRDHLSKYLDLVDAGEDVIVTDHGKVRARITMAGKETLLERLIREGKVTPPTNPRTELLPPAQADGPAHIAGAAVVSDLIERR